jgi:branched-chain amino acid transport system substrate-binding protein
MKKIIIGISSLFIILIIFFLIFNLLIKSNTQRSSKIIKIGYAYPFSYDEQIKLSLGIELAIKEINEKGGVRGKKIELVKIDDNADVSTGMRAAQSLVDNEEILAVIGHFNSGVAKSTIPIYEEYNMVFIAPAATAPDIIKPEYNYIFRTIPNDKITIDYLIEYLYNNNIRKIAIYYNNDDFGIGVANSVEKTSKKYNIEIVDRTHNIDINNLDRVLNRWRAFECEALIIGTSFNDSKELIKKIKDQIPELIIAGTSSLNHTNFIDYLEKSSENSIIPTHFNITSSKNLNKIFLENFIKSYSTEPDMFAAIGYDTIMILKDAIEISLQNNNLSKKELANQLRNLRNRIGVTGTLYRFENGEFLGDNIHITYVKDGEFIYFEY